jgi:hypothetical protein
MKRAPAVLGSAIFLVLAPGTVMVFVPWAICRWRIGPLLLEFPPFSRGRGADDYGGASRFARVICPVRDARAGDACTGRSSESPCCDWPLSLCTQPYVCRRVVAGPGPGAAVWQRPPAGVWIVPLAGILRLRGPL